MHCMDTPEGRRECRRGKIKYQQLLAEGAKSAFPVCSERGCSNQIHKNTNTLVRIEIGTLPYVGIPIVNLSELVPGKNCRNRTWPAFLAFEQGGSRALKSVTVSDDMKAKTNKQAWKVCRRKPVDQSNNEPEMLVSPRVVTLQDGTVFLPMNGQRTMSQTGITRHLLLHL